MRSARSFRFSLVLGVRSTALAILLCGLSSSVRALDADLAALSVETGQEDVAARERSRTWTATAGDAERARAYLETIRAEALAHPGDVGVVRHYIEVAKSQNQTHQLVSDLKSYAEANPKRPEAHYYLGLVLPDEAATHFREALELDPKSYYALVGAASAELSSAVPDVASAKSRLLQAARLRPDEPLAFVVLEQLYRLTGDTDSQLSATAKAVEADPWDARLHQALLRQLQAQAQATQAAGGSMEAWAEDTTVLLDRLARVGPGQSDFALATARIWGTLGDNDRVVEQLRLAADLGFADPRGLEFDRPLAGALNGNPSVKPVLKKMEENRKEQRPELKAKAMETLITIPTPQVGPIPLLGGGTLDLASKRGKVIVLDFWATWCGPCRRALPVVQRFHETKMKDVEIYCVNVFERDGGKKVAGFWSAGGYPMPVALGTQDWATSFGVSSIPTLFLIGPDGQIRYRHQGFSPYLDEELAWIAEGLLGND